MSQHTPNPLTSDANHGFVLCDVVIDTQSFEDEAQVTEWLASSGATGFVCTIDAVLALGGPLAAGSGAPLQADLVLPDGRSARLRYTNDRWLLWTYAERDGTTCRAIDERRQTVAGSATWRVYWRPVDRWGFEVWEPYLDRLISANLHRSPEGD